ncbi:MAG: SpoVR family protein [Candidatus Poribacteria bacterium]|nr:SpoVR family protein [Candidatus Poribacteria bacterium]
MDLIPELEESRRQIEGLAKGYGLDFYDTIFELVESDDLNEAAAYTGFPTRYPHWRFGMEYEELSKGYQWGLQKIYEMVINNDPSYAYLMNSNNIVDQKLVIAHVYGHVDFFKNNLWFGHTNRKMMDEVANHATRIRRYTDKYGEETVEAFMDWCLSIEHLIDPHSVQIKRRDEKFNLHFDDEEDEQRITPKLKSKDYMDKFINPPEFIAEQEQKLETEKQKSRKFPEDPERDILLFLIEHAQLENWQREILSIVREESYYFSPQVMTKIMNEGWASYWHSKIMSEKVVDASEVVDYADHFSGTLATSPGRINPYKLGYELLQDIEERWNKGKFGKAYEECDDHQALENWNQDLGLGMEKLFEVRKLYNDVTFIDEFLTPEFVHRHKMFTYEYNRRTGMYEIADRSFEEIKKKLLFSLTNMGQPFITITDANYKNRGELYLTHRYEGIDLELRPALDTLRNIQRIWGRPVLLETVENKNRKLFRYDGEVYTVLT